MIVVRVEMHSNITGKITEIARAHIANIGGTDKVGNYETRALRGRCKSDLDKNRPQRVGFVENYPRLSVHVWHLVARALIAMGYAGDDEKAQASDLDIAEAKETAAELTRSLPKLVS